MDQVLSPIVKDLPSFVQETPHFLRIIKDFRFPDSSNYNPLLFTMDVTSLYPSIPHDGALQALKHFLDRLHHIYCHPSALSRVSFEYEHIPI